MINLTTRETLSFHILYIDFLHRALTRIYQGNSRSQYPNFRRQAVNPILSMPLSLTFHFLLKLRAKIYLKRRAKDCFSSPPISYVGRMFFLVYPQDTTSKLFIYYLTLL